MQHPQEQGTTNVGAESVTNGATLGATAEDAEVAAITANGNGADANAMEMENESAPPADSGDNARVVSPVEGASHDHTGDDFPSEYLCPFLFNEPPVEGAYFDVPSGRNRQISGQVFEYSCLYRHIAMLGTMRAFRNVFHPITRGEVARDQALELVRKVPAELQAILTAERARRGLPLVDDKPVGLKLRSRYQQTIRRVRDP